MIPSEFSKTYNKIPKITDYQSVKSTRSKQSTVSGGKFRVSKRKSATKINRKKELRVREEEENQSEGL